MSRYTPLLLFASLIVWHSAHADNDKVDFVKDVFPVLETHCVSCHTADDAEGGLVMETFAGLLRGGKSGASITAGVPDSSRLLLMASGKMEPKMPPDDEGLSESELELLSRWIEQGAHGPDGEMPLKRDLRTPKIPTADGVSTPITALAQSSGKKPLRALARFGHIEIHDSNGELVTRIDALDGKVNALSFSRDGKRLLAASGVTGGYGRALIFDVDSGKLLTEMVGHRDTLYAAEFNPDETQVATAGYDRNIILWDIQSGEQIRVFRGHNGAIFDLDFSPDGQVLVSACADETVKVWHVATGRRLDTLGQSEGEVFAVRVTADGKHIVASSADNRLRVWQLKSVESPTINPIIATRFLDETPIVDFALSHDGSFLVSLSESGNAKIVRTEDWQLAHTLSPLGEMASDLLIDPNDQSVTVSLMNGELVSRDLPKMGTLRDEDDLQVLKKIYLDLEDPKSLSESDLAKSQADSFSESEPLLLPRGAIVSGSLDSAGETDRYRWSCSKGEVWAIEADAISGSQLDPFVSILDADGASVLRVQLQAVRDSYFTFRGKDSKQVGDFRIFNWQEMTLGEYLYSGGEVTRLWMHPRGPDSGFNVYPGEGERWTYFGTSSATHALGEPAYIVQPLAPGQKPYANGLPVFDIFYENDDDPRRTGGKGSRIIFTAPDDGLYTIRIGDTRGQGYQGQGFQGQDSVVGSRANDGDSVETSGVMDLQGPLDYKLTLRAAQPSFKASVVPISKALHRGTGREFTVRVERIDGYEGPVTFDIPDLPPQFHANTPLTIEPGQRYATGTIWIPEDVSPWQGEPNPVVVASATILGRLVERNVAAIGPLKLAPEPASAVPSIQPVDRDVAENENWTLQVRRGQTVAARVVLRRGEKYNNETSFGKENSGRNASQGVYVDNIGLNGLLVLKDANERKFFLTADSSAVPGKRSFFLTANVNGGVTAFPITVEVLP